MHLVLRLGEQCVHGVAERGNFQETNSCKKRLDEDRRTTPKRCERPMFAVEIWMEDAFVPAARSERIVRVFANDIEKRLEDAQRERPRVWRHEKNVRTIAAAYFVHKL